MKSIFGSILLAVGILIAGASGLCSLVFSMGTLFGSSSNIRIDLPIILLVGGIPFGIGVALFFGGRALVRQARLESNGNVPANVQQPMTPKESDPPASPDAR